MTPEEIRNTIEQMLAVQRQIQESQIKNTDNIARLDLQIQANAEQVQANSSKFEQMSSKFEQMPHKFRQIPSKFKH